MTEQVQRDKSSDGGPATEAAAILAKFEGQLFPIEYNGQRLNGFLIDAHVAPARPGGYDLILIVTHDRVITGHCHIVNSHGRRVEATATTERLGNANRITISVSSKP